jgi:hypothetical protein
LNKSRPADKSSWDLAIIFGFKKEKEKINTDDICYCSTYYLFYGKRGHHLQASEILDQEPQRHEYD